MTLVSVTMLAWMSGTVALTWIFPLAAQPYVIAACCASFLLWFSPLSLLILAVATLVSYLPVRTRRYDWRFMLAFIGGIALLLIWFKTGRNLDPEHPGNALIPVGISFYSLRLIHVAVDGWKGNLPPLSFGHYCCYLLFLPTLIAGPINRVQEFQRNLRRRRWDPKLFSRGCERILYGYVKIVVFGNYLISIKLQSQVDILSLSHPSLAAYLDCVRYGLNLYLQFSGYSDVAIGFALLLGFTIAENFDSPLLATNIGSFWKKWHISLSSWCRDYVYFPVLSLCRRPAVAILTSMLVLGLWHELSPRYLAWGLYHAAGITVWQGFQGVRNRFGMPVSSWPRTMMTALAWLLTINFVLLSFAITKEPDMTAVLAVYRTIFSF